MLLIGEVREVERVQGSGDNGPYDYLRVAFLSGKADVIRVKFDPAVYQGNRPEEGKTIAVEVFTSAFSGRGGPALSHSARREVSYIELQGMADSLSVGKPSPAVKSA